MEETAPPPLVSDASAPHRTAARLHYLDNIRWVMIVVVICHHAAVTYSHVGGWYYTDGPGPPVSVVFPLATLETFDQAYFMGLLFLIAGYFVPSAFDNKGFARFLRDRSIRLGVPTLFFALVIHPFIVYWILHTFVNPDIPNLAKGYPRFLRSGAVLSATGPMWFALALLLFCLTYALVRVSSTKVSAERRWVGVRLPGNGMIIAFILLMGMCSFLVRIKWPIGTTILNMQLCYFSQYILLFIVGLLARRGNWLTKIPRRSALAWMTVALIICIPTWIVLLLSSGALKGRPERLLGGLHWPSAAFSFWEALLCVGMCLGVLVIFREYFNRENAFTRWMAQNSFAAYLFHTPLLIAVTLSMRPVSAPPLLKFVLASLLAVPITFVISGLVRSKVPGLARLL